MLALGNDWGAIPTYELYVSPVASGLKPPEGCGGGYLGGESSLLVRREKNQVSDQGVCHPELSPSITWVQGLKETLAGYR